MVSSLERRAIERALVEAAAAGVAVPAGVASLVCVGHGGGNGGALAWTRAHPADEVGGAGCCPGDALRGPGGCSCWVPVFDLPQQPPVAADVEVQPRMCGDCAYRKGSPERADAYMEEALLQLPQEAELFFCHEGIRRPVRWEHPDGRVVAGDPADYQPPVVGGTPFRADGRPGLLCAGWAARTLRAARSAGPGSGSGSSAGSTTIV